MPGSRKKKSNSLGPLLIWDRLEVGPIRVEPRKIHAPYTVIMGDSSESTELSFTYEENVFDPASIEDQNLAALALAQVALNYGLFARKLVLHGPFTERDRSFLTDMARNTAREIYVNKFLHPNPFLIGEAASLPPEPLENYLQAKLIFPDPEPDIETTAWGKDSKACCVLSSGGKDSLLSHGLLDELGIPSHPVFVNESGRHWFTALNAYRNFRDQVPNTGRVWTNCDRVFTWMLRRMPFIRPDFATVRADIYPVRLWTVAVFLFGALPVMKSRGIQRLVIGDEFDTSTRVRFRGINHYDGLYDQSRWFDQALTRYFFRKGWQVHQFSVLRHLSELLIEKILYERYPRLQKDQVSCHAAHKDPVSGRVSPCGKCEKCRRIVGMLTALGADPGHCGYTQDQIAACLLALRTQGTKQESAGAAQMIRLLDERGLWESSLPLPAAHPEILQVRIDREHAPLNTIPTDLRQPLLRIFLEHAQGAVKRSGRMWLPCDIFNEQDLTALSPHEARTKGKDLGPEGHPKQPWLLGELTWPEAERRFQETDIALLPVGAIEQHGPHLPLDVDAFDAQYLAQSVAAACSDPQPLVLPLIPYGVSYHHEDFAGTLSVRNETMAQLIYDIGICAARCGTTKLVIINGHGGNGPALAFAAQMINRDAHIFTCVESGETSDVDIEALAETGNDVHAGEIETSTSLALRPGLVDMSKAQAEIPRFSSRFLEFSNMRSVDWNAFTSRISSSGVMGDPTKADAAKGQAMWDVMIKHLVEFIEDLKGLSLEEIHQRRY